MPGAMWPHMLWPPKVPRQQKSGLRAEDGGGSPYSSLYRTLPATWFSSLSSESLSSIPKPNPILKYQIPAAFVDSRRLRLRATECTRCDFFKKTGGIQSQAWHTSGHQAEGCC